MIEKQVGYELKKLRIQKGLTIETAAKLLEINKETLYKYEKDASNIRIGKLKEILEFYEEDLFIFFQNANEYIHNQQSTNNLISKKT